MSWYIRKPLDDPDFKKVHYGRYSDERAYDVITSYLDGHFSVFKATTKLYDMLPNKEERNEDAMSWVMSGMLLEIGRQIPYSHHGQIMMVRLVDGLGKTDKLAVHGHHHDEGYGFYDSFQVGGWELRERYVPFVSDMEEDGNSVNMCAFVARLTAHGVINSINFPIWDMQDSLESEITNDGRYNRCISGASMWFLCAGQWLFDQIVHVRRSPEEIKEAGACWKTGGLYQGPELGIERWKFWQKGFTVAAESARTTEECRKLARKAANIMHALSENNAW